MNAAKWILTAVAAVALIAGLLWLFGPAGGFAGILGAGGLFARRIKPGVAEAELEAAADAGSKGVAEANEGADKEIEDGMAEHDNLADYLNSLDKR